MQVMAGAVHGGAEAFFERLVPALSRAGVEQCAVIRKNSARAALLRAQGLETIELPFGGFLDLSTGRGLSRAVREFKPDVQLAWMSRAAKFCRPNDHVVAGRMGGYYDLKYYRYCHHLIGNTRDIRDYIVRSGWPAENAWYLPNFVDSAPMPAINRSSLDTADGVPVLLALGRLHVNKGFDVLLTALESLPHAVLWIGGVGPEETALKQLAGRLRIADRVRFLGWRDDVPALMAAADVYVCSSRHEPLGNVVLEAWAQQIPIVATVTSGPESLIENHKSGLLVPIEDAQSLSAAIKSVLGDANLAAVLVEGGAAAYSADYTEQSVVAQYCDFFQQVTR